MSKTLNPTIHGGILAIRENKKHMEVLKSLKIPQVDLVVVNLYPFEEIRENLAEMRIKLLKVSMSEVQLSIRAAAKNFRDVIVVVDK